MVTIFKLLINSFQTILDFFIGTSLENGVNRNQMVAVSNQVYSLGGLNSDILKYDCPSDIQSCAWKKVGALEKTRGFFVAMTIDDALADQLC